MAVTVSIILLLAGCREQAGEDWQLEFIQPGLSLAADGLDLSAGIVLDPSAAVLEALERGVSVTFLVNIRASRGRVWLPGRDVRRRHRFHIDYLPLSRYWQLTDLHNETRTTYPRLNMLLASLRQTRSWDIPLAPDEHLRWVQARIELDRTRLPSPMRLPTWFQSQWRMKGQWQDLEVPGEKSG